MAGQNLILAITIILFAFVSYKAYKQNIKPSKKR